MLMNCKQSTQLLSQALDRELNNSENIQLKIHLLSCKGCRNFRLQMDFLRSACQQIKTEAKNTSP